MSEEVDILLSPHHLHRIAEGGFIHIDVDGGITKLSADFKPLGETCNPFPTSLSTSILSDDKLTGFWIDHELLTARLAQIDISSQLQPGISRADLRLALNSGENDNIHVRGAEWSHAMNAELMAMAQISEVICFALWKRGIYGIDLEGTELWRQESVTWPELEGLQRAEEIVSILSEGENFRFWGKGGGWALISPQDGKIVEQGILEMPQSVDQVFHDSAGGWLVLSSHSAFHYSTLDSAPSHLEFQGPVNHANWDDEISSWRITGWRQDAIIGPHPKYELRSEIGVFVDRDVDGWKVLDNSGNLSSHMDADDTVAASD